MEMVYWLNPNNTINNLFDSFNRLKGGITMKKTILLMALALVLISAISYAQTTDVNETLPSVIVLPDSPIYPIKLATETVVEVFKFTPLDKAKYHLELAQKRLAELEQLPQEKRAKFQEKLLERYDQRMLKLNETIIKIQNTQDKRDIEDKFANATQKHLLILQRVKLSAPIQAQKGLDIAISNAQNLTIKIQERIRTRGMN